MDARVKPGHDSGASGRINKLGVIAGLDPAIHLLRKSWITGSRR
jgi:hypothetical protein